MSRATSIAGVRPLGWLARLRAHCKSLAWACPEQLLGGWLGRCGAGANHGAGQGARDEHARQRSGARPRVVQTDTLHAPEACDSSEAAWARARVAVWYDPIIFVWNDLVCLWNPHSCCQHSLTFQRNRYLRACRRRIGARYGARYREAAAAKFHGVMKAVQRLGEGAFVCPLWRFHPIGAWLVAASAGAPSAMDRHAMWTRPK